MSPDHLLVSSDLSETRDVQMDPHYFEEKRKVD